MRPVPVREHSAAADGAPAGLCSPYASRHDADFRHNATARGDAGAGAGADSPDNVAVRGDAVAGAGAGAAHTLGIAAADSPTAARSAFGVAN